MKIPGFTAEASLYNTTNQYRISRVSNIGMLDSFTSRGEVLPQARKNEAFVIIGGDGSYYCYEDDELQQSVCEPI